MNPRLLLAAVLISVASAAAAVEQRIPLPGGETMTLAWEKPAGVVLAALRSVRIR